MVVVEVVVEEVVVEEVVVVEVVAEEVIDGGIVLFGVIAFKSSVKFNLSCFSTTLFFVLLGFIKAHGISFSQAKISVVFSNVPTLFRYVNSYSKLEIALFLFLATF